MKRLNAIYYIPVLFALIFFVSNSLRAEEVGGVLDVCKCPAARCDECHSQQGISFFTPNCKDGTKLSCARANCVEMNPLPPKCEQEKQRKLSAERAAKAAKDKELSVKTNSYATFAVVHGDVQILRREKGAEPALMGKKIESGDIVLTGENGRARLLFTDSNVLNLTPGTKLELVKYEFDEKSDKKNTMLQLHEGQVRSSVNQKYDTIKNHYQVKTPSAVAGVRGTDFLVAYNSKLSESKVVTFRGEVEFGKSISNSGSIMDGLPVKAGQSSAMTSDMIKPRPVQTLTEYELVRMESDTQISPVDEDGRAPSSSQQPVGDPQGSNMKNSNPNRKVAFVEATCMAPNAALYECTWEKAREGCVRKRCFADGLWKVEARERDAHMCFEGQVKACD